MIFQDRSQAGKHLAKHLQAYANRHDVLVLGLPRGGVPVAFEVAAALHAPLDVLLVRKLGTPGNEECAMGAIASGGVQVLNTDLMQSLPVSGELIEQVLARERVELERRERLYRRGLPALDVRGKSVILVDDGLATGATMRAAVTAMRALGPARVVVAVPVGSGDACDVLARLADEVICLETPTYFSAVGQGYQDFPQTSDAQVLRLLEQALPQTKRMHAIVQH